ncbi:MAG: BMP family ABC transporter substrate-binding protein [Bacteroidales bacterium]|nr:BMP family ABC transporter substrate-binding protein [Bacteroidales bacterium]
MKRLKICTLILSTALLVLLPSCHKDSQPELKIGLISGVGGFSDRGFNENILAGFQKAATEFPITCQTRESLSEEAIAAGISDFISDSCDLIITAGYAAAQATLDAALANPGIDFLILDYSTANLPSNMACSIFDVDQSSFPCGFLAAYWAYRQNPENPRAGYVAGVDIPQIRQFSQSYIRGIAFFNEKYQKDVQVSGYFANSFIDTLQGAKLADSLLQQGASVIFAFAGKTGNGALYRVQDAGKWAIGVDVDQYYSIPQVGPVLLTSCVKKLDNAIYGMLKDYRNLVFSGGQTQYNSLSNNGVGMAPFHDYETMIPDSIKAALTAIESGIKNGSISTGWNR